MKTTVLALASFLSAGTEIAAQDVGLDELTIAVPHHDQDMQMAVMFPAVGQHQTMFAENAIFYGTSVFKDAEPVPDDSRSFFSLMAGVAITLGWRGSARAWLQKGNRCGSKPSKQYNF